MLPPVKMSMTTAIPTPAHFTHNFPDASCVDGEPTSVREVSSDSSHSTRMVFEYVIDLTRR